MLNKPATVAVGMSGGVDSSTAASILKSQGFSVIGLTMTIFSGHHSCQQIPGHACYGPGEEEDLQLAREVCSFLNIPHHEIDLREEYRETVLDNFTTEYLAGRTPNPCTRCNPRLKFGLMLENARKSGISFELFATGHYVRSGFDARHGRYVLRTALDPRKDQSYFLYGLKPDLVPSLRFPLGDLTKDQVRERAEALGLPVYDRPESQDFVDGGDYSFLFSRDQILPGPIVGLDGKQLGTHKGIINYTVGQRRGIGIPHSEPLYVQRIDPGNNTIVVGPKDSLLSDTLTAVNMNFLAIDPPASPIRITAKIRQNHTAAKAELIPVENGRVKVVFDSPQLSITPGQSVVLYEDEVVLGGGVIQERL